MTSSSPPSSILIIGSGVFGLSTARALARRRGFEDTDITVVDRSTDPDVFPSRDASSIDTSRIVRADYSDAAYAALAAEAQVEWRRQGPGDLGGEGRYTESGLVVVADVPSPVENKKTGMDYVRSSWENVVALAASDAGLASSVRVLPSLEAIRDAVGTGGACGSWGYLNTRSGWADADASMRWLYGRVRHEAPRIRFASGTVSLLRHAGGRVTGAELSDGRVLSADLTIVAAGAWTGSLVDLAGQATATGQVLAYMDITEEEQTALSGMPVLLNMTTGLFVIPPAHGVLKMARHAYGYLNPVASARPLRATSEDAGGGHASPAVSVPLTHATQPSLTIPAEGSASLRAALREMVPLPALQDRPFTHTRLCWYTDTPTGDFLIDYHPSWEGLFLATGGSGHGFKFLPVIGEKIADCVVGERPPQFSDKWAWKTIKGSTAGAIIVTEDGSRGGTPGLILQDEMDKA